MWPDIRVFRHNTINEWSLITLKWFYTIGNVKILWKFARLIVELPYCWLLFELDRTSEIFCWQKKHILSKLLIDKKHILLKLPTVQIQVDYEQERQGTWVWSDIILQKCESIEIREAILYQIGCFFTHCVKGGRGGVVPMCKNLCCGFLHFWRPFHNIKLTQNILSRVILSQF